MQWTAAHYCDFDGVECDSSSNVVKISMNNNNLHGNLPGSDDDWRALKYLQVLKLTNSFVMGNVPSALFSSTILPELVTIDLVHNRLSGALMAPDSASKIRYISVDGNTLSSADWTGWKTFVDGRTLLTCDIGVNCFGQVINRGDTRLVCLVCENHIVLV